MIRNAASKTASDLSIRATGFLREAVWLTRRRVFSYATILIAASAAIIGWTLTGHGINDPLGRPVGTDFVSFWTVSSALIHGDERAIYSPDTLAVLEQAVRPRENMDFYAWQYPPIALLLVYPLAFLPYLWSLASWLAVGMGCYLTALWRILPQPLTLWAGLAFPAVLLTVGHGQNSLLTTGLFAWGLLLLEERPIAAGVVMGLLSFKPQLGLLLPIALLAGGHWRTVVAATLTSLGLAVTTVILFGSEIWSDFFMSVQLSRDILDKGLVPYYKMQSVFAAVRLLGSVDFRLRFAGYCRRYRCSNGRVGVETPDRLGDKECRPDDRYAACDPVFSRLRFDACRPCRCLARSQRNAARSVAVGRNSAGGTLAGSLSLPNHR